MPSTEKEAAEQDACRLSGKAESHQHVCAAEGTMTRWEGHTWNLKLPVRRLCPKVG